MNVHLHLVATMHMGDAYNSGVEWTCGCAACEYTRQIPELVEAIQTSLQKEPPQPDAKKSPPVSFIPMP